MKRILALLLTLTLGISVFSGCQKKDETSNHLNLITSFYPIYIMTLNITDGVDGINVENMADQNIGCLHDFQIQTEDIKKIEKADAFIINGASMESFIDKIIDQQISTPIIDSSTGIELIKDDPSSEEYNPHIWVSISNYIEQVKNISKEIIALDPQNKDKYQSNTNAYLEKLTTLKDKMHNELSDIKETDIITFHEAFPYFAKEFNLNIVGVIDREPNSAPSAQEISDTINLVNDTKIKALFAEPQYSPNAANVIAAETGATVYFLDPCSSGETYNNSYLDAMEKNLAVLKEALS